MKRLWNFIRSTKRDTSMYDDIGVSDLHKYFSANNNNNNIHLFQTHNTCMYNMSI